MCNGGQQSQFPEFLSKLFGKPIAIVRIQQAEDGANKDSHYFAETADGERYGFKATEGTKTVRGANKEKLIWNLASILEAPHFCQAYLITAPDWMSPLNGKETIVTHWLKGGKALGKMNGAEMQAIEGLDFWNQIGEWLVFGLAFGISDRHLGNWVWSDELKKLAIIDTEMSLQKNPPVTPLEYVPLFRHAPKLRETLNMHPEKRKNNEGFQNVISGALKMNKKIREKLDEIKKHLQEKGYPNYSSRWLAKSDEDLKKDLLDETFSQ